jgi:hypothetical protein
VIAVQAGNQLSIDSPHTLVFFIAATACLVFAISAIGNKRDLNWQRKAFWGGTFGAATCIFLAFLPNITAGLTLGFLGIFLMGLPAYFNSQYIKIGSRVIAFESSADLAEPRGSAGQLGVAKPYGPRVSAAKLWWLMVPSVGLIGAGNFWIYVLDREDLRYGLLGLGIMVSLGVSYGIGDATKSQRVARGQYLPFAILGLMSAGIFTVSYLAPYLTALGLKKSPR